MEIKIFLHSSSEYQKALQLRTDVLRTPLGLKFTQEELEKDKVDIHFGLFDSTEILACLTLTNGTDSRMKMCQVAVNPNFQGRGLGKQLAIAAENYAKQNGFDYMFCHARETAVDFYKSLGYKVVSEKFTEVNIPHFAMEKLLKC